MKHEIRISILILLIFSAAAIGWSCSGNKPKENPEVKSTPNIAPSVTNENAGEKGQLPAGVKIASKLTPEVLKEAHELIPAYPNAELDTTKGNYSNTTAVKVYNIIYHTSDPVDKVADFFRKNIAEEYRSEVSSKPGESEKWIHIKFGSAGFSQTGTVAIMRIDEKTTEIVYYITQPLKGASSK